MACGGATESGGSTESTSSGGTSGTSGRDGNAVGASSGTTMCPGYVREKRTVKVDVKWRCDVDAGSDADVDGGDAGCRELTCHETCEPGIMSFPGTLTLSTCTPPEPGTNEAQVTCEYVGPPCGRRPEGLSMLRSAFAGTGAWLAACAYLEEASIAAFGRLARELEAHSAPSTLVDRARLAARDEARHALAMRRLARRAGHEVPRPEPCPLRTRTLEEVAIENASEGCVRETYGALLATFQAMTAEDSEVKSTMEAIAEDETAHATLAWDVRAWLETVLDEPQRARVDEAALATLQALADELAVEPDRFVARELGVPTAAQAGLMLQELFSVRDAA